MSTYDLDALAALEAAATKGEWRWVNESGMVLRGQDGTGTVILSDDADYANPEAYDQEDRDNAALIAAARNALPAMLRDLREAREVLGRLQYGCNGRSFCPECLHIQRDGHAPDCRLNQLLTRMRGE